MSERDPKTHVARFMALAEANKLEGYWHEFETELINYSLEELAHGLATLLSKYHNDG